MVFLLVPNPIVFKRDGAQLLLCFPKTRLQLFFVGKEERQNSNNVVEVSQKCQKSGCVFVKSRQGSVQLIVFCGKVEAPITKSRKGLLKTNYKAKSWLIAFLGIKFSKLFIVILYDVVSFQSVSVRSSLSSLELL